MTDGVEKIVSPLRKAMSKLDYGIPDYIFDSSDGDDIKDLIDNVWEEIDNLEYKDMTWDSLAEQGHSPKMIESILAKETEENKCTD